MVWSKSLLTLLILKQNCNLPQILSNCFEYLNITMKNLYYVLVATGEYCIVGKTNGVALEIRST